MMTKISSIIIIFLFGVTFASAQITGDSSAVSREFSNEVLEEMRADKDYAYINYVPREPTWWDKFKNWLQQLLLSLFEVTGGTIFKFLLYGILTSALVYIALSLAGIKVSTLLSPKTPVSDLPFELVDEEISSMNFNELIKDSINDAEYRKAIRLTYLWSLQKLNQAELINWRQGKTNEEYLTELSSWKGKRAFAQLSGLFEKAWYGKFGVDKADYGLGRELFDQINSEI